MGTKVGNEANAVTEVGYATAYEDTVVLDSPLAETQLEKLVFDAEAVGDGIGGAVCKYEEEVVLDSEDEGVQGSKVVNVVNGVLDGKAGRRLKGNVMDLWKGQPSSPCKPVDMALASNVSNQEQFGAG